MSAADKLERAMLDPCSVFAEPEDVLSDADLTREQKIAILLQWEYNASEEDVALEEGMPGEDSDDLRRVLIALGQLTGPIDVEHMGPTKQRGLSRSSVGMTVATSRPRYRRVE